VRLTIIILLVLLSGCAAPEPLEFRDFREMQLYCAAAPQDRVTRASCKNERWDLPKLKDLRGQRV